MYFHCGLAHFGNCSMLIRSTPGAPLLALTFFHASAILAFDTMYSTDAKSMGDDSVTRLPSKSPLGVEGLLELTGISALHCLQTFPENQSSVLVFG
jgi:hypothetical protein